MKPTIGRVVIYKLAAYEKYDKTKTFDEQSPSVIANNGADECPAVVVRVWNDNCVNLKLLTDGPGVVWRTSALLGDGEGQWQWPARA